MDPTDAGVRLAVGEPGAGKTYGIRADVLAAARAFPVIVVDRTYEWHRPPYNALPRDLRACYSRSVADAKRQIAQRDMRLVIVSARNVAAEAEEAIAWAVERSDRGVPSPRRGVAVHEAHHAWPNSKDLSETALDAATAWRHWDAAIWLDTQRLAELHRTWDLAREIRFYAPAIGDFERIRKIGGRDLERALRDAKDRLQRGDAGWHVVFPGPIKLVKR